MVVLVESETSILVLPDILVIVPYVYLEGEREVTTNYGVREIVE